MNSNTAACAETAHAKINLALHVTGKRADGYHELDSLVVFADVGDQISATAAAKLSLTIQGGSAETLPSDTNNSVLAAAHALLHHANTNGLELSCAGADLVLEKTLPISAGVGGGSADAAATLRALNRLWGLNLPPNVLEAIGIGLGADVAVCIAQKSCRMSGIGEKLVPLSKRHMPGFNVVLVNPGLPVSTPQVFQALQDTDQSALPPLPDQSDRHAWLTWLEGTRNDLFEPACRLCPDIEFVIAQLVHEGAQMARMSGSGATCFGIFDASQNAVIAAQALQKSHPNWWICPTHIV
ncbi:4-(cytidine 5'-diphospho)-2-C-methyl-D-erythritol kinase [Pararhizobium sp. IMCC21322]|uniref:4-(cytidine 5'-diphospho)-2-C-methyl-D-erythritol kinase n=1 Tax=Pararhizobium sp. IMCC21322 TaxID=3067903 RepID=UPI0027422B57|nr:4-(cytidine 5'-diphospho)-2-C-methyl-D-erythritol kinase [Pararhizobium sp. IMCC21322]